MGYYGYASGVVLFRPPSMSFRFPNKAVFFVDCRPRLNPEINANYFGNCIVSKKKKRSTRGP